MALEDTLDELELSLRRIDSQRVEAEARVSILERDLARERENTYTEIESMRREVMIATTFRDNNSAATNCESKCNCKSGNISDIVKDTCERIDKSSREIEEVRTEMVKCLCFPIIPLISTYI